MKMKNPKEWMTHKVFNDTTKTNYSVIIYGAIVKIMITWDLKLVHVMLDIKYLYLDILVTLFLDL